MLRFVNHPIRTWQVKAPNHSKLGVDARDNERLPRRLFWLQLSQSKSGHTQKEVRQHVHTRVEWLHGFACKLTTPSSCYTCTCALYTISGTKMSSKHLANFAEWILAIYNYLGLRQFAAILTEWWSLWLSQYLRVKIPCSSCSWVDATLTRCTRPQCRSFAE